MSPIPVLQHEQANVVTHKGSVAVSQAHHGHGVFLGRLQPLDDLRARGSRLPRMGRRDGVQAYNTADSMSAAQSEALVRRLKASHFQGTSQPVP